MSNVVETDKDKINTTSSQQSQTEQQSNVATVPPLPSNVASVPPLPTNADVPVLQPNILTPCTTVQTSSKDIDLFFTERTRVFNMREKWFTLSESLSITDAETGKEVYKAVGKLFHLGADILLKDSQTGVVLCEVKSKVVSLLPEYDIFASDGKTLLGKIRKEVTLLTEKWHFTDVKRDQKWELSGDFANHDWKIHKGKIAVAGEITRKHSYIKEHYGVTVHPGNDMLQILCVAICMEKYHHDIFV